MEISQAVLPAELEGASHTGVLIQVDRLRFQLEVPEDGVTSIWRLCDGVSSIRQIAEKLEVSEDVVALDVRRLQRAGLLESPRQRWRLSCTRRDLMQRAAALGGLAVASVVMPSASAAASLKACKSPCGGTGQCTTFGVCPTPTRSAKLCCCARRNQYFTTKHPSSITYSKAPNHVDRSLHHDKQL